MFSGARGPPTSETPMTGMDMLETLGMRQQALLRQLLDHKAGQTIDELAAKLKREVGRLVVQTTATVTGKVLTPEDHRRLAEETVRQVSA